MGEYHGDMEAQCQLMLETLVSMVDILMGVFLVDAELGAVQLDARVAAVDAAEVAEEEEAAVVVVVEEE